MRVIQHGFLRKGAVLPHFKVIALGTLVVIVSAVFAPAADRGEAVRETHESKWVHLGPDGKLVYAKDEHGNRLPDFSSVGYHAGERDIPTVPYRVAVEPDDTLEDHTALIQGAIDRVAAMPFQDDGFRGAVLIKAGTYKIADKLYIRSSGIVLRGEGQGPYGTTLIATGFGENKHKRTLVTVSSGKRPWLIRDAASKRTITDDFVPIGATQFHVESTTGYNVGDEILIYRPSTAGWIKAIGCDQIPAKWTRVTNVEFIEPGSDRTPGFVYQRGGLSGRSYIRMHKGEAWEDFKKRIARIYDPKNSRLDTTSQWQPGSYDMDFQRRITTIDGNKITIDVPLVHTLDKRYGGGAVYQYTAPGRIENIGIEKMRLLSQFGPSSDKHPYGPPDDVTRSEQHGWNGIVLNRDTRHTWVRHVTGNYFGWSLVSARGSNATITDCVNLGHASKIRGGRRYPFMTDGQMNLFQRCVTVTGRHEFVVQARTWGPNVFVDCIGLHSKSSAGPHHRYGVGTLSDNVSSEHSMESRWRGASGTGHGWAGTQTVFYNCIAPGFEVNAPPGGISWVIGSGDESDIAKTRVQPASLYYQQLRERLGEKAVLRMTTQNDLDNIGTYPWLKQAMQRARGK